MTPKIEGRRGRRGWVITALAFAVVAAIVLFASGRGWAFRDTPSVPPPPTEIGLNLIGLLPFNRQQVFTNMIAQSEWFSAREGQPWAAMPAGQLNRLGWVRFLAPGQAAPRLLTLPPAPFHPMVVRCRYEGTGTLDTGGVAAIRESGPHSMTLDLKPTGAEQEGAWIELLRTDPADPVRNIDCRADGAPEDQRFSPEFLDYLRGFRVLRFLDWQQINDNPPAIWAARTLPESSSQAGPTGIAVENMVDLVNAVGADPWFLMPYKADDAYIRAFAQLVHARLDPRRTVYVELSNEVWNDQFDVARQAQAEGLALGLGDGDPGRARAIRYARQHVRVMRIWTEVFADRPGRLVRVCSSQNANPDLAKVILADGDTAAWTDALATAPYAWIDLTGYGPHDVDRVFAAMPGAIDAAFALAAQNRAIAARYGKRYIAYEGGQHLVTTDLTLARAVQRDPRMGAVYTRYLQLWRERLGDTMMLFASTAPISEYGSWGLREYAGQPLTETPKLRAVRAFLKAVP